MRQPLRLISTLVCVAGGSAHAQTTQTLFHVSRNTYGCANPRATLALTNPVEPRRTDPGWVAFVVNDGHCAPITPRSPWRLVSRQGDLAYMTYAGTTGLPGSFYLKSDELVEMPVAAEPTSPSIVQPLPSPVQPSAEPFSRSTSPSSPYVPVDPGQAPLPSVALPAPVILKPDRSTTSRGTVTSGYIDPPEARTRPTLPAAAAPEPTANPVVASPAISQQQSSSSSGGGIVPVLLALVGFFVLFSKLRKKPKSTARTERKVTAPPPVQTGYVHKTRTEAPRATPSTALAAWQPKGTAVTVAGHRLSDGMIYVGHHHPSSPGGSPCFIDPALEVARSDPDAAGVGMPYWPSYSRIPPRCRLAYLQWLASGRSNASASIGYVFLFFYGLERRLFIDGADPGETAVIVAEVERLRRIYGASKSFAGYSTALLEAVELKRILSKPALLESYIPDLTAPAHAMPTALKLAIATRVARDQPLQFELAVGGLLGLPPETLPVDSRVLIHARTQLLAMLRSRFEAACPLGFKLAHRKDSKLELVHRCATAGLQVDLVAVSPSAARLPDPATLTWSKLVNLIVPLAKQLEPYAKRAAHRPHWTASLEALSLLPPEVRAAAASGPAYQAAQWLQRLPKPLAEVPFTELAHHVLGEERASCTPRRHEKVCEALGTLALGVEPAPGMGTPTGSDDIVMVFPDVDAKTARSSAYHAAAVGAELVSAVSRINPAARESVEKAWLSAITQRLPITPAEQLRLKARLRWSGGATPSLARIRKGLADASSAERATVAWSAASAAAASGLVAREQVAVLEKVYDNLGLSRQDLYSTIHGAAADLAANVPVSNSVLAPGALDAAHSPTLAGGEHGSRTPVVGAVAAGTPLQASPDWATVTTREFAQFKSPQPALRGAVPPVAAGSQLKAPHAPDDEPVFVAAGTSDVLHGIPAPPTTPVAVPTVPVADHVLPGQAGTDALPQETEASQTVEDVVEQPAPLVGGAAVPGLNAPAPALDPRRASSLDEERLRQIRAETERVSAVLASVFLEDEPPAQVSLPATVQGDLPGLDPMHGKLVRILGQSSTWSRADFEKEAALCGLLPDGALEVINEWAYDQFDDALIEDGDPLTVRLELLPPEEIADAA